jgi:hypothetical protein
MSVHVRCTDAGFDEVPAEVLGNNVFKNITLHDLFDLKLTSKTIREGVKHAIQTRTKKKLYILHAREDPENDDHVFFNDDSSDYVFFERDIDEGSWVQSSLTPPPSSICRFAFAQLNSSTIVICGGVIKSDIQDIYLYSQNCYKLNIKENVWVPLPPLLRARSHCKAIVCGSGSLLVIGGERENDVFKSTERLSLYDNKFVKMADMHDARSCFGVCTLANGNVIVCGGYNNDILATVEMYEWKTNKWTRLPDMPIPRSHCEAFTLRRNDKEVLVVCGGAKEAGDISLDSCVLYDFEAEWWIVMENMIQGPRREMGFCKLNNDEALLVGGYYDEEMARTEAVVLNVNAPRGERWQTMPSFDLDESYLICVGSAVM